MPAERLGKPVSADLEELLMRCLAKNPASRPASARELDDALGSCVSSGDWTRELADEWWRKFAAMQSEKTMVMRPAAAMDEPDLAGAQTV
jgi:serine/threonine-protein kinase